MGASSSSQSSSSSTAGTVRRANSRKPSKEPTSPSSAHSELHLLSEEASKITLRKSRWNPLDYLLGTRRGQVVGLLFVAVFLNFLGALVWMTTGGLPELYDTSWSQSLWFAWGMFFDPGTQMGFPADAAHKFKLAAVVFSVAGFIYNLLLLGIIVEVARISLDDLRKKRNCIIENGHTLVLNWSEKTLFVLKEMIAASKNRGLKNKIVILAEEDELDMLNDIRHHFSKGADQGRFICRKGRPYECDDLIKACAKSARDIIILGHTGRPRHSDLEVVRTTVALAALPQQPGGHVIAEVRQPETASVLHAILPRAEGIIARDAVNRVLCLQGMQPLIGDVFESLISFVSGEELYCKELSELGPELRNCKTFGEACRHLRSGTCIGVNNPKQPTILAPRDDHQLREHDRLVMLANSEQDLLFPGRAMTPNPLAASGVLTHLTTRGPTGLRRSGEESDDLLTVSKVVRVAATEISKLIIVGWPCDMSGLLAILDDYAVSAIQVHILSEKTVEERTARLEANLGVGCLRHLTLEHHVGPTTSVHRLGRLPYREAYAIIVLGEDTAESASASDSSCLATAVTLDQLRRGKYPPHPAGGHGRLICEVLSARTERVLKQSNKLKDTARFFHSNAMETGLFAMASAEPAVFNTLLILLQPDAPGELAALPAESILSRQELASHSVDFWELWDRLRAQGAIFMGWERAEDSKLVLNYTNREQPVPINEGDQLIVLRRNPEDGNLTAPGLTVGMSTHTRM